jgi:hypothetical protein
MASITKDWCCLYSVGTVSIGKSSEILNNLATPKEIGICSSFQLEQTVKAIKGAPDTRLKASGTGCQKDLIEVIQGQMEFNCFLDDNITNAFYGTNTATLAGLQTETFAVYKGNGSAIAFSKAPATPSNIVVKGFGATAGTTYVLGTDYTINEYGNGINIPASSSIPTPTITAGVGVANITVTYTSLDTSSIGMATKVLENIYMQVAGANVMADAAGDTFLARLWNVTLSPAKNFNFISTGNDANKLEFTIKLNQDKAMQAKFNSSSPWGEYTKPKGVLPA